MLTNAESSRRRRRAANNDAVMPRKREFGAARLPENFITLVASFARHVARFPAFFHQSDTRIHTDAFCIGSIWQNARDFSETKRRLSE